MLEVGVNETFDDGPLGKLDDREGGQCTPACVGWTCFGEPDQLANIEVLGSRDRPVGVAGEEGRGRVLLPDQFEHDLSG